MRIINNCSEVLIASDLLQNSGPFVLTVDINGCQTITLHYQQSDVSCTTETNCGTDYTVCSICVKPEQLSCLNNIPDGVLTYTLSYTEQNTTYTEQQCNFSACELKCRLVSAVANNLESDILHKYCLLTSPGICENCEDLITIYECLLKDLQDLENGTDDKIYTPCGTC